MSRGSEPDGQCIRCGEDAPAGGYCAVCRVEARVEVTGGIRQLAQYLAAWAAFDEWCERQADGPATG
jgi:hypothetical protein